MEEGLQEPAGARAEEGMGAMHETGSTAEDQREILAEKMPKQEEDEEEEEEEEMVKRISRIHFLIYPFIFII
jgi:hypothetical protein